MLERQIQAKILRWLRSRPNSFTTKIHGGASQRAGLPDIYHQEAGVAFWFEVKRPDGTYGATALQLATIAGLIRAGAVAAVVTSLEEVQGIVQRALTK